ncbi:transporter substrate-binding domain-containing protein [Gallaecimonas kandeliae]|uniref:substrate-binding periplasmic protein n=1 Tax=Gallaecimonas kandeliae TaxID=3029055 RepID=UPI0026475C95|nr:transporter substrate-binding domain-containing protein [Gallaecimonas kandeliae]WKE64576.1 transporter substrate-binding domain-containing protein [Gallaecimonas kandeliae]
MRNLMSCLLAALLLLPPAMAEEGVPVAAGIFTGLTNAEGTGPYQQVLHEAARRAGIKLDERVYPMKRAQHLFREHQVLALYGMTEAILAHESEDKILASYPVGAFKIYFFTLKGQAPISRYAQLAGKTVGGVLGNEAFYRPLKEKGIKVEYLADESTQLKKLEAGRIAALVGFIPDLVPVLDKLSWDPRFPLWEGYDYMTVWKTPEGQAFVNAISPALVSMHDDGTTARILGKRFVPFDYHPTKAYEWRPEQQQTK